MVPPFKVRPSAVLARKYDASFQYLFGSCEWVYRSVSRSTPMSLDALPPEMLTIIGLYTPAICFALINQKCRAACPRRGTRLCTPRQAVCHASLELLTWARACGCTPPRKMSRFIAQLDLNLDRLSAIYHDDVQASKVTQLPFGAIIPPTSEDHSQDVTLARDANGQKLVRPRPLTFEELHQVVYCRPLLWTGQMGDQTVDYQMWHVLFAADEAASTAFTLSRLLDVIAYFVGYFKPRHKAADWRHVSSSVWDGVFDDHANNVVWTFQHLPSTALAASSRLSRLRGLLAPRHRGESALETVDACTRPRPFIDSARVCFDDEDEDLRHLRVLRLAQGPAPRARRSATRIHATYRADAAWAPVEANADRPYCSLDGQNVHGHLVHFFAASIQPGISILSSLQQASLSCPHSADMGHAPHLV